MYTNPRLVPPDTQSHDTCTHPRLVPPDTQSHDTWTHPRLVPPDTQSHDTCTHPRLVPPDTQSHDTCTHPRLTSHLHKINHILISQNEYQLNIYLTTCKVCPQFIDLPLVRLSVIVATSLTSFQSVPGNCTLPLTLRVDPYIVGKVCLVIVLLSLLLNSCMMPAFEKI